CARRSGRGRRGHGTHVGRRERWAEYLRAEGGASPSAAAPKRHRKSRWKTPLRVSPRSLRPPAEGGACVRNPQVPADRSVLQVVGSFLPLYSHPPTKLLAISC